MPDVMNVLGYEDMTPLVRKFEYEEQQQFLAPNVPLNDSLEGDIATWHVEKPDIEINDYFVSRSGAAEPVRQADWFQKTFAIPYRFKSKTFNGGELGQLTTPGTLNTKADPNLFIDREMRSLNWKMGPYLDEYLIGQALQGTLSIKLGNATKSVTRTVDYEIPTGNKFTNNTSWGGSPTTAKPIEDFNTATDILGEYGVMPMLALMSNVTAQKLVATTQIQNYVTPSLSAGTNSMTAGMQYMRMGTLPPIMDIQPVIIRSRYASAGQTDGFKNKVIADNKVVFIPAWPAAPGDWIESQGARIWIPNDMQNALVPVDGGVAAWRRTTDSPTGLTCFLKIARFPVIRKPWVIAVLTIS